MMTKQTLKHLLLSTAFVAAVASPAAAQVVEPQAEAGDPVADAKIAIDEDKPELQPVSANDVVVTGTRIIRPNNRSAAPIVTTTSADIAAQGALTIEEVLNRLPQVQANGEQNFADSEGRQRVKLRNLGFERTLTLVDGLRLGIQNGQDVSIIPTALVERIDVLSGGASSVYGSDAISGVINYILKKNFDGISLSANYSFYNHDNRANAVTEAAGRAFFPAQTGMANDGGRIDASLAAGKTLFDGALNITGFVNYRASEQVNLADRSSAACEVTQPTRDGPLTCTRSTYTTTGTILPQGGPSAGRAFVNNPDGSGTFVNYNSGPGTAANPFDGLGFQRKFNRLNAGGFVTLKLADALELYSTTLWYRDRSQNPLPNRVFSFTAYGGTPFQVNCNNPFLSAAQAQSLCGAQAGTAVTIPIDVRYRFDGLPSVQNKFENTGVRVTGGVRGALFDNVWRYDLSGVYARNKGTTIFPAFPDFDRVSRSLNVVSVGGVPTCAARVSGVDAACVPFNAFIPNNNDATLNNYLFTNVDGTQTIIPTLWQGVASITGDLGKYGVTSPLAEQGIAIAIGGEYRAEKFVSTADALFRQTNGGTDQRYTQNVKEANVEIQVPLVEHKPWTDLLQVNGGYRVSKYNRLESTFDTYKVEGLWAPVADVTFRGSFNKAQRAPTVIEAVQASDINYTTIGSRNDPCATIPDPQNPGRTLGPTATLAQCQATGLPANLYGSATLSCPDQSCTIRNGGFGLTPETAFTKTFGVIVRPRFLPGLTVSVDRFLIDLNDSIGYRPAADFINGCLATLSDYYCRGIVRNPGTFTLSSPTGSNPTAGYIAQGTTNGFKSKSHGWDFQGQYLLGLGAIGRLDVSFNGTLTTLAGGQGAPELPPTNCVGYYGPFCGESLPKWKHQLRTTWQTADRIANISLNWRHVGPMTLSYNATDPSLGIPVTAADRRNTYGGIKAYNYFDLSAAIDVAKQLSLRLSVNNLFDKDPPLIPDSRNLLGLLRNNTLFGYDLLGRQLVAGATMRF
ncbi:TonB-dependent receptor domain-containing protein [Sphingomonas sp.]|jgi:outer membrane receptor protein involved in Fe transport|uniref:TonB-dependent receptor domain-containing protein n=1 Tax=Sphingomonas sp. TaxID=28214 RepID=UPI002ED8DB1A